MEKHFSAYHERYAKKQRSNDGFESSNSDMEFINYRQMTTNEVLYVKFKSEPNAEQVSTDNPIYQMTSKKGVFDVCCVELRDPSGNYYGDFLLPVGVGMKHLITGVKKDGTPAKDKRGKFIRTCKVGDTVKIVFRGEEESTETGFKTYRFDFFHPEGMTTNTPPPAATDTTAAATGAEGETPVNDDLPF